MNYKLIKNNEWKEVEINGEMKEVPVDWWVDSLNNLCDVRDGTHESPKFIEKGIHFVTTKNLINGKIDFSSAKFISEKDHEDYSRRSKVDNGDILLGMIGTVGNPIMVKNKSFDFSIKNLGLIKTKNKINQNFLFFEFNKTIEDQKLKADGGVLKFITLGVLRNIQIYYPSESEQSSIASILSIQESIIQAIEYLIDKYESRFNYLSDELLSGRIRVKEVDGQTVLYKNPENNWKEVEINGEIKEIPFEWQVEKISNLFDIQRGKVLSKDYIQENKGIYPVFSSATENDGCIGYINSYMLDGEYLTWTTDGVYAGTVFYRNGKFNCTNICGTLKSKNEENNLKSLFYFVREELIKHVNHIGNSKLMSNVVSDVDLLFPSENEQVLISNILTQQEELIQKQKELLSKEKQKFDWLLDNLLSGKYLIK